MSVWSPVPAATSRTLLPARRLARSSIISLAGPLTSSRCAAPRRHCSATSPDANIDPVSLASGDLLVIVSSYRLNEVFHRSNRLRQRNNRVRSLRVLNTRPAERNKHLLSPWSHRVRFLLNSRLRLPILGLLYP